MFAKVWIRHVNIINLYLLHCLDPLCSTLVLFTHPTFLISNNNNLSNLSHTCIDHLYIVPLYTSQHRSNPSDWTNETGDLVGWLLASMPNQHAFESCTPPSTQIYMQVSLPCWLVSILLACLSIYIFAEVMCNQLLNLMSFQFPIYAGCSDQRLLIQQLHEQSIDRVWPVFVVHVQCL